MHDPTLPLQGIKVIELASVLAGPAVGMFLAELGAEVIKIEPPQGDVTRQWKLPEESGSGTLSAYFSSVNWGKKSLVLNLKDGAGQAILSSLAEKADIIITNFKQGAATKLAADYKTLSLKNPKLIYASISAYGEESPRPGYDALIQAESGFMSMNGTTASGPLKMPVALMDLLAAHQLKEAILLALLQRTQTGKGREVTVSLLDSALATLANQATNWLMENHLPQRIGTEHPNIFPYGTVLSTQEGEEILLAIGTNQQFATLCEVLEIPKAATDPRFRSNSQRVKNKEVLRPILANAAKKQKKAHLIFQAQQRGVPLAAIMTVEEALNLPAAKRLALQHETAKALQTVAFQGLAKKTATLLPPPQLGADSEEVLKDWLKSL